jgi:ABC-type multidrug transport system fused ATPase/permease subunit
MTTAAAPLAPTPHPSLLQDLRALIAPRRGVIVGGLALVALGRLAGLALPLSIRVLVDQVLGRGRGEWLGPLALGLLGALLLQGLASWGSTRLLAREGQRLIALLRARVQAHVLRLPLTFYSREHTGSLVSRILGDAEGLRHLVGTGMAEFAGSLLTALLGLLVLVWISPLLTLLAIGLLLVLGLSMSVTLGLLRPLYEQRARLQAELSGRLSETLGGIAVVKGYHAEAREAAVFAGGSQRLLDNALRMLGASAGLGLSMTAFLGLAGAALAYFGGQRVLDGRLTMGELMTFGFLLMFLASPLMQVVSAGSQLGEALAGLRRLRELLAQRPEEQDPRRSEVLGELTGEVVFEGVSFGYDPEHLVLEDISLRAAPGSVTALVGPSGAGKSTLVGLVAAFHTATAGRLTVDGVDLSRVRLDSWRTRLGLVLQETFLFDGTIRENVAFARPGAAPGEIEAACQAARVEAFTSGLPDGLDTVVGERGVRLSGGQRQRIAIARALLADPRILILDEATASLDSESEELIQQALERLVQGRTTFVIAHRLSTIRRADTILVLEHGRIVERGSHAELLRAGGRYREMCARQQGLSADLFLAPGEGDPVPEPRPAVTPPPRAGLELGELIGLRKPASGKS